MAMDSVRNRLTDSIMTKTYIKNEPNITGREFTRRLVDYILDEFALDSQEADKQGMTLKIVEQPYTDLIASGYEWECLGCDNVNVEDIVKSFVVCTKCNREFVVREHHHCKE